MIYDIAVLAISLAVLAKFSDVTIKNAVRFSQATGVSQMAVGFIIIAVSTSIPELLIGIISSSEGQGPLSMGNVFGANISNMALIFGLISFYKFRLSRDEVKESTNIVLGVVLIALAVITLKGTDVTVGIFLLIIFCIFSRSIYQKGLKITGKRPRTAKGGAVRPLILMLVSVAIIITAANFVVGSAIGLAGSLGVATAALGATIVSIGTTVPEMSVNIAAVRKKNIDLALGDSMGSVMTNITLVLGAASVISPIQLGTTLLTAAIWMVFVGIIFLFICRKASFGAYDGAILITIYAVYLATITQAGLL